MLITSKRKNKTKQKQSPNENIPLGVSRLAFVYVEVAEPDLVDRYI